MGNVQSLTNKIDEISANCKYLNEFRSNTIMTHTSQLTVLRYYEGIGQLILVKGKGGGVCIYVNEKWCHPNNALIKHHSCFPNIEILTVSLRPYYLPREFSHIIIHTVYVPHRSVAKPATLELVDIIDQFESSAPDAFTIINGDFNHCDLRKSSVHYYQQVKCATRDTATLDLLYTNVKDAYLSIQLPKLGKADHNLVNLVPRYRSIVKREKARVITIQQWNDNAVDHLRAELDSTDWNMFVEASDDLNELTQTISDYISFCVDNVIPKKEVKVFPNNKPWITKKVKTVINKKKGLFKKGDSSALREVQKELKRVIAQEKAAYRDKIESLFTDNNMRRVWDGIRLMSGYRNNSNSCHISEITLDYANDLNHFYNRFDQQDFSHEYSKLQNVLTDPSSNSGVRGGRPPAVQ
ncbi:hypothetical protein HOLleu_05150 [Holothuria leucospilota]|uniref:Endonuclease/exonuclease/phosphatase domain-containing protein n=1 Tax=Holothuria leucospilota TaxID=206669 RepID=A0A9Q1CJ88_HOLLE|nr:hypothetical protein HOLleu_05150 [Holothuria leucospilota]